MPAQRKRPLARTTKPRPRRRTGPIPLPSAHPDCLVVGIGASAGGLEAVRRFFAALPPSNPNIAFVVIQHLDPTHPSLIVELLTQHTRLPVVEAADAMKVQPGHIYIIPPGESLTLNGKVLRLIKPLQVRGLRTPIDDFFRSLAETQQQRAIGIILTGAGSDGSSGLKDIKDAGGMIMAQDPDTAAHDGMPRSAIQTGLVDFILPVEKMPHALLRYASHPYVQQKLPAPRDAHASAGGLQHIIALLRSHARFDFRQYKDGTLQRRVYRRMGLQQIVSLSEYLTFLRKHPNELDRLAKDLLISVTSFFREPEAFSALARQVIAPLPTDPRALPVRVWIPGSATGEEAYSIAILLFEHLTRGKTGRRAIQLFATDVDDAALAVARAGIYSLAAMAGVSPERRKRHFLQRDDAHFQVKKELRESITFARQNILEDPPFSRLDLICCRNVMIYLRADAQKHLLERFHFALHSRGCPFLGSSESVGPDDGLFETVSKKWRIFRKIAAAHLAPVDPAHPPALPLRPGTLPAPDRAPSRSILVDLVYRQLLQDHHAPAAALINRRCEVIHLFGPVGQFLEVSSGEITRNLLDMARSGLQTRLRGAVRRAIHDKKPVLLKAVTFKRDGAQFSAALAVQPLASRLGGDDLLLVTFKHALPPSPDLAPAPESRSSQGALVRQLEEDLRNSREDLHNSIRELETANEELRASNEEAVSVNEELQSTNEELETSKEELQSLNEELSTVNAQLQGKIDELENANNDLDNLISSTDQATISLDRRLRIKWFTPATARLIPIQASDRGRPLSDLALDASGADLLRDARAALHRLKPVESELATGPDSWHLRRAFPFRTKERRVAGVVITFVDITDRKNAEQALARHNRQLESAVAQRTAELQRANTDLRNLIAERERLEALVAALVESKRVQVGMELHDNLGQSLAATGLLVSSLAQRLRQAKSPLADTARKAADALDQAGQSAHNLARGLIPVQIEAAGLMSALSDLAAHAQKRFRIPCSFECDSPVPVADNSVATHLFYIAQEAVNNAARHAKPSRIRISLHDHVAITLTIADDGRGLPLKADETLGSGLRIMRYRARVIGAAFSVRRAPKGGTVVQCVLPEGSKT